MSQQTQYPVFDGHNDALMDYIPVGNAPVSTFFERNTDARLVDLPRAKEGHYIGGFFAVFVPDGELDALMDDPAHEHEFHALDTSRAHPIAMAMVANLFRIERESDGQVQVVRTVDEIEHNINNGVFSALLHFEGAEPIDADLHALEVYYQAGLRSLGLVWSRPTIFAEGVPFKFNHSPDTGPGLTDAGKALVKACNQLGIMIDLSHLNEKGFWDVAALSDAPLVATHSNAHALAPSTRNLTDKQLDAIKEHDGMVGINLIPILIREDGANDADVPMETMVRQIDYLVERIGIDRVGIGADMGVMDVPRIIKDAAGYPVLMQGLRDAGYSDDELHKIGYQNWLRVLRKTWKVN
ncbi:MAG: membrane dipeptidase [Chloroflexi bacterium]|nr:MAG: membrane dipeptidase [Chloroflexota bacterium]